MDLLGPSLCDLLKIFDNKFLLKTVLQIALQVIDIIEHIHSKHLIHCDIKPENICVGHILKDKENIIHVVDFGLAKKYVKGDSEEHFILTTKEMVLELLDV